MRSTDRRVETVAIDWETAGPGPVGADLASLIFSSARRGDLAAADIPGLIPGVMDAYAEEVAAGAAPDAAAYVAGGFWGSIALRWSLLRDIVAALVVPGGSVARGRAMHEAPEVAMAEFVALMDVLREAWRHVESGVLTEGLPQ
jgi:N-acetylglucosamine kinase-like BadF-type ATPase